MVTVVVAFAVGVAIVVAVGVVVVVAIVVVAFAFVVTVGVAVGVGVVVTVGIVVLVWVALIYNLSGVDMEKSKKSVSPLSVGKNVLIRTVTFTQIGHVVSVTKREILLSDASWVADGGRFSTALSTGKWTSEAEIEKVPGIVSVSRGAIVDAYEWLHELPNETV